MTSLDLSKQNLIRIEIEGDVLIAYPENGELKRFSLAEVTSLCCSNNQLTSLPLLPQNLETLFCSNNQLTSLPLLPKSLERLYCSNNQLTSLPSLPEGLEALRCSNNQLTSLPSLSEGLKGLDCCGNQLTSLASLPEGLKVLYCFDNPLKYIPFFKERPLYLGVPEHLETYHSKENYQEGYRLQKINRYLFLVFFTELDLQLDFLV